MRFPVIIALGAALGGCWTSGQQAATTGSPGDQFVGQNVDAVVARYGKPAGRKKLDNDQMTYVWEFPATDLPGNQRSYTGDAGLYGDGRTPGTMSDDLRSCKVSVVTSSEGIVTQFNVEESNGTGAPTMTLGLIGGVCARRLQMKSQS
jgi:hypothetical protein